MRLLIFDEGRSTEELDHLIGFMTTLDQDFGEFDVVYVEAGSWAIFKMEGQFSVMLQKTWAKIFSKLLPSSGFEWVNSLEISFDGDMSDISKVYSEIWMPVNEHASRK